MAEFCKTLVSTLLIVMIASAIDAEDPISSVMSSSDKFNSVHEMKTESNHYYSLGLEQNGNVKCIFFVIRQICKFLF